MLSRQKWDAARFHETLVSLVGAAPGDHVLDLGCGQGASLGALLNAVRKTGKVYGLNESDHPLQEAAQRYAEDVESGRLSLRKGDALDLPFPDATFDAVLCQNVVECVHGRQALVAQAKRVLKPGGRLLLGHHDFDGIMIAGGERGLTRRLIQSYADHQQDWQDASEGQMGRLLPGLAVDAGFETVEVETRIFVDLDLAEGSYAHIYVGGVVALAPAFGVHQDEAKRWAAELVESATHGRFFFGLPWVGAICRKIGR